mgnify:CR=1 FL=1
MPAMASLPSGRDPRNSVGNLPVGGSYPDQAVREAPQNSVIIARGCARAKPTRSGAGSLESSRIVK